MLKRRRTTLVMVVATFGIFFTMLSIINLKLVKPDKHSIAQSMNSFQNKAVREAIENCDTETMYEIGPRKCRDTPLILVLVVSAPNHSDRRKMLRQYLGTEQFNLAYGKGPLWKIVFVVSRTNNHFLEEKVRNEVEEERDIILGSNNINSVTMVTECFNYFGVQEHKKKDTIETEITEITISHLRYKDTSSNLVYKTLIGIGWAYCQCMPAFLLKSEDDVFLNLRIMANWLLIKEDLGLKTDDLYVGISTIKNHPVPVRRRDNNFYISEEDYPFQTFPPFILGAGYLLSSDVLRRLIPLIPKHHAFTAEDIYIGMLLKLIGIAPQNNEMFLRQSKPYTWATCDYSKILLSQNAVAKDFPKMFRESLKSEIECMNSTTLILR